MAPTTNIHAEPGAFPPTQNHLGTSSFSLSQDPGVTKPSMCSVFKKDYASHPHYSRSEKAVPPKLGDVMHQDDRFFNEKSSETSKSFEYRYMKKPVLLDIHSKLSATNFKMDRDTNKFKCFSTTHSRYFTPHMTNEYERAFPVQDKSIHFPQGDREKADNPISDYRDHFPGHDTRKYRVKRAASMHEGGPPTITGDKRLTDFRTSTGKQFVGTWQPKEKPFPAPTRNNIPEGDKEKIAMRDTTTGLSYPPPGSLHNLRSYKKDTVCGKLYQTNFKQQDGHGMWNDYISTAKDAFLPKMTKYERHAPDIHRNHSHFPEGDRGTDAERVNMTTNRFYHGNPPRGLHNTIVCGAGRTTWSNVWFGDPALGAKFYSTSTNEVFQPKTVPHSYHGHEYHQADAVPVGFTGVWDSKATTLSDYQNPHQGKTMPHPVALEQIKKCNIFPPMKSMYFQTTHRDLFTPHQLSEKTSYDSGRFQRSSVPLGTLQSAHV